MPPSDELFQKIDTLLYHINLTENEIISLEIKLRMLNKELLKLKEDEDNHE